jgi:outer membrane protein OmpA-like peptidoglycan-associated protein
MSYKQAPQAESSSSSGAGQSTRSTAPGKSTLTSRYQGVQRAVHGSTAAGPASANGAGAPGDATPPGPHQAFAAATSGAASDVPYVDHLQSTFGADFSQVQAYKGQTEAMDSVSARAMTDGQKIAFRDPSPDRETVAHELAHVVQHQRAGSTGGINGSMKHSQPGDAAEREADAAATAALLGQTPEIRESPGAGLHGNWLSDAAAWVGDRVGDALDMRDDEERLDAEEELRAFMAQTYDIENFHPSTGRGLFNAEYDPTAGVLAIIVNIHFDFRDGSPANHEWVNKSSGAAHPPEAFQWQDDEKTAWAANTLRMVRETWEGQYMFHCTRQYWEALPDVNVNIDIQEVDAGDAHYDIEVHKWPENVLGAHVDVPGATATHSGGEWNESAEGGIENPDESHFVRTPRTRAAYNDANNNNPGTVLFDAASSEISAAQMAALITFGQTLGRPEMPPFPVNLTGHASADGSEEQNQRLSEDRAREVNNVIVSNGAKRQPHVRGVGELGADATPEWRRVDIVVGNFESDQHTVVHEFGHIFGLGDEYPRADSPGGTRQVGDEVAHSDLAEEFNLSEHPVVAHHSESIMSNGEVVNPWHYATFLEVLTEMTDTRGEWAAGPGSGPRLGPGDFPVVTSNGTAMA